MQLLSLLSLYADYSLFEFDEKCESMVRKKSQVDLKPRYVRSAIGCELFCFSKYKIQIRDIGLIENCK